MLDRFGARYRACREHVVLDKAEQIGNSSRKRWDSFALVMPNWQLKLPGHAYEGDDAEGFLSREEVVAYLEDYVDLFDPPLRLGVEVTAVARNDEGEGSVVHTDEGIYEAENVVVAAEDGAVTQQRLP